MRLSIITINYNNKAGLRRTIESVRQQKCKDFEYIVVDGDSTDGSKDVMLEYDDVIDIAISERDTGIYNAMNKGVRHAHGDFLLFLNSGDWLNSTNVTEVIIPYLTESIDILSGYVLLEGKFKRHSVGSPESLTISSVLHAAMSHQSTFIRRSLLTARPYNENYRIISDWIFFLETSVFDSPRYQHIEFDVAVFENAGLSSNGESIKKEGDLFWPSFLSEHAVRDISSIPPEIYTMFRQLPDSYKFKRICVGIIKFLFNTYAFIRPGALHKQDCPSISANRASNTEIIRF